ncbi:L,D-transpeptidase family protein [Rhodoblastus acidophilus]|uniref:L,D-transpeptidase family protein n=1 Tax=Candidatus Rhodoblastus alkanivorans TaxID=2954117 RepID=A0ABS9ZBU3_9HYPH|nr:L,D-transpeptidase family protein [Candidatus Rhodoblastus alkanivorans]MCI4680047.1 L,D-transpeptidase family protein [Candidatus Rhodoblastus alkanivorans]MCI4684795.1 L,D-transpeptidase family protein [Candidatus Rhodoblastus alkanivorans]MDI4642119.1 L,D-transpeptidase family protein [Rhodoblastus acidophilus]
MRRAQTIPALRIPVLLLAVTLGVTPFAAAAQSPLSPEPMATQPVAPAAAPPAAEAPAAPKPAAKPAAGAVESLPLPPPAATPAAQAPTPAAPAAEAPAIPAAAPMPAPAPAAAPMPALAPAAAPHTAAPRTPTTAETERAKPKPRPRPKPVPREMALSDDPTPVLQPETFYTTAKASERYAAIADAGGWPTVPAALRPGSRGPAVEILRRRLAIEGDLVGAEANGTHWTPALAAAVKRFQFRNGLKQTGIVAGMTLRAMNVPANVRFKQLASSAQRLAGLNFPFGDKYVVVNIPSTAVDAVENGHVVHRYAAIVGGPEHQSPQLTARIVAINLNPTWTVPVSIIKNEIIPKMRRQPNYLERAHIRILNYQGKEINPRSIDWNSERATNYILRQDPGKGNALGLIRIQMPNPDAVYMHDTPTRNLFANDYRFLSHGCVRVEGVYDLAAWLLQGVPVTGPRVASASPSASAISPDLGVWTSRLIRERIATGVREDIKLPKPVPVVWVYLTGWASADGVVHFRDDVYTVDTVGG